MLNSRIQRVVWAAALIVGTGISSCTEEVPAERAADLILINGRIYTVDSSFSQVEAVAIKDGRFAAVGANSEVEALAGSNTRRIDLKGTTIVPGMGDSHNHQISRGAMLNDVDLTRVRSIQDILDALEKAVAEAQPGQWIVGTRGWWEYELEEDRYPTRWELDKVSPQNPVTIPGPHYRVVNSKALELAGIDKNTPDPVGGEIYHDPETGEPDGLLMDRASGLVTELIPQDLPKEKIEDGLREIMQRQVANGLTMVREPGVQPHQVKMYQEFLERDELPMRLDLLYRLDQNLPMEELKNTEQQFLRPGQKFGDGMIRIDAIKMGLDGAERSAFLRDDYPGKPGYKGLQFIPTEKFKEICAYLNQQGWRVGTHVVGDAAIDEALDAYEFANSQNSIVGKRWALEHAFLVRPDHFDRARKLELVINTQYMHNYSLGKLILDAWQKPTADLSIPIKSWIDRGLVVAGGSDGPVSYEASPLLIIYGSVTRNTGWGQKLGPEEGITREQALRTVTYNVAYASFMEDQTGSIEAGKYADLVLLSDDLMQVPEERIKDISVLATIVGGKVVYEGESSPLAQVPAAPAAH